MYSAVRQSVSVVRGAAWLDAAAGFAGCSVAQTRFIAALLPAALPRYKDASVITQVAQIGIPASMKLCAAAAREFFGWKLMEFERPHVRTDTNPACGKSCWLAFERFPIAGGKGNVPEIPFGSVELHRHQESFWRGLRLPRHTRRAALLRGSVLDLQKRFRRYSLWRADHRAVRIHH